MVNQPSGIEIFQGLNPSSNDLVISGSIQRGKQLQYWRKCAGCSRHVEELGWIVMGPVMTPLTAVEYTEYQQVKHSTPLPQYGQYFTGVVPNQKYNVSRPEERFKAIIEQNGINEFPLDQMIAYNWHRIPLMQKLYPELAAIVDVECEYGCVDRKFSNPRHYQQHISAFHPEIVAPTAIGAQMSKAMAQHGSIDPAMLTQLVAAVVTAMKQADEKE